MSDLFVNLPPELREVVLPAWSSLAESVNLKFSNVIYKEAFFASICKVLASSHFVVEYCLRNPDLLLELTEKNRLFEHIEPLDYQTTLLGLLNDVSTENELWVALRRFRNREMIRIAWRDISGWAGLEETLMDLTRLAEACLNETLDYLFKKACQTRGTPINQLGETQGLVVLGMGKLGAWELNFSSDIDLIFAYEDEGYLTDKKSTSYSEFYTRLARSLVQALDTVTSDGFVFRVDTRLRPFGDSGALVMTFDGMEQYYHGQARDWERYAMVKARVVAGDFVAGKKLQAMLIPFVYRRYIDFRAFGELRALKAKISQELLRKDRLDNIKLGLGGIREIEFIGQAFQLIRGGQEKCLRERSVLKVLDHIGELGYLPFDVITKLRAAYCFLRLVENRIQQYSDRQTHDLPTDTKQRCSLAFSLGFDDWNSFSAKLAEVRTEVHGIFGQVIESPHSAGSNNPTIDWVEIDEELLPELLAELGYAGSDTAILLRDFRQSHAIRRMTARGGAELGRIMPLLLQAISPLPNANETLARIFKLLEAVAGRNVYFTLLAEYPQALSQLVKLASASSWIVNYIARFPLLLDELLDPRSLYAPLSLGQLRSELARSIALVDSSDVEQLMTVLRQFKQANVLKIAAADIAGAIPIMVVSDYLTWLAEVIVAEVLNLAWHLTAQRYGVPPGCTPSETKGLGVVAYGKLGGLELSYASDLDLVFLYGGVQHETLTEGGNPIPCAQFYARVVKRCVAILTTQVLAGTLYEIDLRLRPSGNSGLLVSSLDAYETYQMEGAWTWEQQALVRTRFIAGDPSIGEGFAKIRERSLTRIREVDALREEVRAMRDKMRESLEKKSAGFFDLKQSRGGIADIEFIVQFGVLSDAHDHKSLLQWPDVVRLLDVLRETGFLDAEQSAILREAYCRYRERTHRAALLEQAALAAEAEFADIRPCVQKIWREKMERRNPHP